MNRILASLLNETTQLKQARKLLKATAAIQRVLGTAKTGPASMRPTVGPRQGSAAPSAAPAPRRPESTVRSWVAGDGESFTEAAFSAGGSTRHYKLFQPGVNPGERLPLVVLLHGCTQDPDDFARGTGMNDRAREQGFFVLYPAQSNRANFSKCWNWFKTEDQHRGGGEPAFIAALTAAVIREHDIDPDRVYVAGLSAGGAMAAIVGAEYPEIFAAVGVHSGLPGGAASNLPDALSVMRNGALKPRRGSPVATAAGGDDGVDGIVRTIVFHGDRDHTVHPGNGQHVIDAALAGRAQRRAPTAIVSSGTAPGGKGYTRSSYAAASGETIAEHWLVHGVAHAWSGGSADGTYTDGDGPSATDEMLRFFFEHPRRGA